MKVLARIGYTPWNRNREKLEIEREKSKLYRDHRFLLLLLLSLLIPTIVAPSITQCYRESGSGPAYRVTHYCAAIRQCYGIIAQWKMIFLEHSLPCFVKRLRFCRLLVRSTKLAGREAEERGCKKIEDCDFQKVYS